MNARGHAAALLPVGWMLLALLLSLTLSPRARAEGYDWANDEYNVSVHIPETPFPWSWLPYLSAWKAEGIVRGAQRKLATLKNGDPAHGEGAILHVAVRDLPKDLTMKTLPQDEKVRGFLLKRFEGHPAKMDAIETSLSADGNTSEVPAVAFHTEGQGFNLEGKKGRCIGTLVATIVGDKLILFRLYAFPTEYDEEGVRGDIDFMEGNAFAILSTKKAKKAKKDAPKAEAGPKKAEPPKAEPKDDRKDTVLECAQDGWRMTVDKRLEPQELTDQDKKADLILKCAEADRRGSYAFYIYQMPTSVVPEGAKTPAPPPDLIKWMTVDWWNYFTNIHPKGALARWVWPRRPFTKRARTFLTLPDFTDEKNHKVVFEADQKRPPEVEKDDMIKRFHFVEEPRDKHVGRRGKVHEAVRGIMEGKNARDAHVEQVFRFAFRGKMYSYRVFVLFNGEAHVKWADPVRKTLESWEFGLKIKD
jgi:hypothetical protein